MSELLIRLSLKLLNKKWFCYLKISPTVLGLNSILLASELWLKQSLLWVSFRRGGLIWDGPNGLNAGNQDTSRMKFWSFFQKVKRASLSLFTYLLYIIKCNWQHFLPVSWSFMDGIIYWQFDTLIRGIFKTEAVTHHSLFHE